MSLSWKTCLKVGISIFLLYLCITYWSAVSGLLGGLISAASPLFIGAVLAYLINIIMSSYEKHFFPKRNGKVIAKLRRPLCLFFAYLSAIAVIALVIGLIVPQLVSCIQLIIAELPAFIDEVIYKAQTLDFLPDSVIDFLNNTDWQTVLTNFSGYLTSGIGNVMGTVINTVTSVFSGIVTAFISIIFSIYVLMSRDKLSSQVKRLMRHHLRASWCEKINYIASVLNKCFRKYIIGQCTEAVILGALCTIGMWILRLPYAPMIGALIAFTALIPIAGAYIGAGVGAFLILMVSPVKALIFLIFIVILQQFEGNIIYPKVVGTSLGLPGLWVLAAVTVGGGTMGVLGMLLGVPLMAAIYKIIKDDVNNNSPLSSKYLRDKIHKNASKDEKAKS